MTLVDSDVTKQLQLHPKTTMCCVQLLKTHWIKPWSKNIRIIIIIIIIKDPKQIASFMHPGTHRWWTMRNSFDTKNTLLNTHLCRFKQKQFHKGPAWLLHLRFSPRLQRNEKREFAPSEVPRRLADLHDQCRFLQVLHKSQQTTATHGHDTSNMHEWPKFKLNFAMACHDACCKACR